jgi:DNA polymerase III sliding clamp (beta) subunit (PCNA family)
MLLRIPSHEIKQALKISSSVVNPRSPKEVLQCVLVTAKDGQAVFHSTGGDVHAAYSVACQGEGEFILHAKKFSSVCTDAGDDDILFEMKDGKNLTIKLGKSHFKFATEDPRTFPRFQNDLYDRCTIEASLLRKAIECTSYACSNAGGSYSLEGVFFNTKGGQLDLAASDGRRVSVFSTGAECADIEAIVPSKAVAVIRSLLGDETATIGCDDNRIKVSCGKGVVVANLLAGRFLKYQILLDKLNGGNGTTFFRADLLRVFRQVGVICSDESMFCDVVCKEGKLLVSKRAEGREFDTDIDAINQGDDFKCTVNASFVTQAISPLGETIELGARDGIMTVKQGQFQGTIGGQKNES